MNRILLDVGSFRGDLSRRAVESGLYDAVHAFEPLPTTGPISGVQWHGFALGHAGRSDFFYAKNNATNGASFFGDKTTGNLTETVEVPSRRLSEWLIEYMTDCGDCPWPEGCEVDLHLNAEGAEYLILPDLFVTGVIDRITRLSVEWHAEKIPSIHKGFDASLRALVASLGKPECLVRE